MGNATCPRNAVVPSRCAITYLQRVVECRRGREHVDVVTAHPERGRVLAHPPELARHPAGAAPVRLMC